MLPPVEAPAAVINFGARKCEKISRLVSFDNISGKYTNYSCVSTDTILKAKSYWAIIKDTRHLKILDPYFLYETVSNKTINSIKTKFHKATKFGS